jgi:branched-chain amino acid transport system permease protein
MIILGGIGNIYGVIIGGVIMASYDRFFAENITAWLHTLGNSTHMELLSQLNLQNARLFIFGAALVLTMLLRPEGLFPSWRRAAELHGDDESSVIPPGPTDPDQQTLYDVEHHDEPVVGTE